MDNINHKLHNSLNIREIHFTNYPHYFTKYRHTTQPKLEKLNEFCKTEGEKGELTRVYLPRKSRRTS